MSGHSKWATIHRQKGINDAKKGAIFTKLGNMITIAVREGGGGDPESNFKLRLVVDKARSVNMPKENIQRAIDRASANNAAAFETALFEGFLPGGAGVLIQTMSDNKVRSQQFVREALEKSGGTLASSGAVSHSFTQFGEICLKHKSKPAEECELELIDLGAEDFSEHEGELTVWVDKSKLMEIKVKLEALGYEVSDAELTMKPVNFVEISDNEKKDKIEMIIEKLEDLDDVSHVWTNYAPV